jgi:hypothetical protein
MFDFGFSTAGGVGVVGSVVDLCCIAANFSAKDFGLSSSVLVGEGLPLPPLLLLPLALHAAIFPDIVLGGDTTLFGGDDDVDTGGEALADVAEVLRIG